MSLFTFPPLIISVGVVTAVGFLFGSVKGEAVALSSGKFVFGWSGKFGVRHAYGFAIRAGLSLAFNLRDLAGRGWRPNKMKLRISGFIFMAVLMLAGMNSPAIAQTNMSSGMRMMSSMDQKFMMMAAKGGMMEIEMARLALQKSTNESVRQYAQKMIDDHTMAGDELKQLAASKGVMLPMSVEAKHMAMMAKMQRMSGMDFDMMYVKECGVKAHQDMEKLYMKESMSGKDMETKAWAAKTLPVVRMHLQMAREWMMNMKAMKNGMSGMKM